MGGNGEAAGGCDVHPLYRQHALPEHYTTSSHAGALQVWRRQKRGRALSNMWASSLVLSCPIDDDAAAAARRRRRAPPNPSINQVAWTMDDNKVSASCLEAGLRIPLCTCLLTQ